MRRSIVLFAVIVLSLLGSGQNAAKNRLSARTEPAPLPAVQEVHTQKASEGSPRTNDVFFFLEALDAAARQPLWPGFNPSAMPIAFFDGKETFLVRHPSPPPEFFPMPDRPEILVFSGHYPAVVANSTRMIGGVRTGTVLALPGQDSHGTLLASLEEVFHIFWLPRHPSFRPNEMVRYEYPVDQPENLNLLIAEDEALARSIEADSDSQAAAWGAAALQIRMKRTASLPEEVRVFENALEAREGTANYVSRRAAGETVAQTVERLRRARPADGIRWRFYDSGTALCLLLDRFMPDWKRRSEEDATLSPADLLSAALTQRRSQASVFSAAETAGFRTKSAKSIAALKETRAQLRADVLARLGARVVIQVAPEADSLMVERFDPINLSILDKGEVVHANYLTLKNESGSVDVSNQAFIRGAFAGTVSLTEPGGIHPIRDGIRRLTIVGISADPAITREKDAVKVETPELHVILRNADVHSEGRTVLVTIAPARRK